MKMNNQKYEFVRLWLCPLLERLDSDISKVYYESVDGYPKLETVTICYTDMCLKVTVNVTGKTLSGIVLRTIAELSERGLLNNR